MMIKRLIIEPKNTFLRFRDHLQILLRAAILIHLEYAMGCPNIPLAQYICSNRCINVFILFHCQADVLVENDLQGSEFLYVHVGILGICRFPKTENDRSYQLIGIFKNMHYIHSLYMHTF